MLATNGFWACAVWLSELPASMPPNVYLNIQMFVSKAKNKLKVCEAGNKWLCDVHVRQIAQLPSVTSRIYIFSFNRLS